MLSECVQDVKDLRYAGETDQQKNLLIFWLAHFRVAKTVPVETLIHALESCYGSIVDSDYKYEIKFDLNQLSLKHAISYNNDRDYLASVLPPLTKDDNFQTANYEHDQPDYEFDDEDEEIDIDQVYGGQH